MFPVLKITEKIQKGDRQIDKHVVEDTLMAEMNIIKQKKNPNNSIAQFA